MISSPRTTSQDMILEDLNPSQAQAVRHGPGPQLVVAGAGTGKTAVITRRIAHLVATKACTAREILALTFTDKAAEEMESRVDLLVPYGFTDSTICTFHAFGDRVLREQGLLLGMNPNYTVLSAAEQLVFLREHLFDLPLKHLRPLSDPTRHLKFIAKVISRAKDEDVDPVRYLSVCETHLQNRGTQAGEADRSAWEKQHELARVYGEYQRLLLARGLVDFGDLIIMSLRLFREHPEVLAAFREQYRYILVDEFQDTNAAQFDLLRLLAGEEGNITVVGDDDQSIYKFRGAAISNILQFKHFYPTAKLTVLNENYRSPQSVLDTAYRLIQHNNPDRLEHQHGLDKRLRAARGEGRPVQYRHFDTVSTEADWVADQIRDQRRETGASWSDFAVLVRNNRHADPFLRSLNLRGIPSRFSGYQGLYRRPEIKVCLAMLRTLADPQAPLPLHDLAASELYDLPAEDLARLNARSRRQHASLKDLLQQAVAGTGEPISETGRQKGRRLLEHLSTFQELARRLPTGQVLYRFLTETGILSGYTESNTLDADLAIRNLAKFFQVVQRYQEIAKSDRLEHFVAHLDMLEEVGDDPGLAEPDPDQEAVNVLTVHRAKGLEFPCVFLAGLAANRFPTRHHSQPLQLPLELTKEDIPAGDPHLSEERRLFYVGLTRTIETLVLTSARDYGGSRTHKVSRFVMEALELPVEVSSQVVKASALEKIRAQALPATTKQAPAGAIRADEALSLSFYQIDDYLTCPLKYKYVHLLKVPVLPHHAILYGKALHTAITEYCRRKMAGQSMSEDELTGVFQAAWVNVGFISREHEEMRQQAGLNALKLFMNMSLLTPIIPKYIEKSFSFNIHRVKVTGRMDRVDVTDAGETTIIDYKSSEINEQAQADKKTRENLQLKIYALAWLRQEGRLPVRVQLHFLDSGLVGSWEPELEKTVDTENKITLVAEGIRAQAFAAKPNVWVCNYCPYRSICPQVVV